MPGTNSIKIKNTESETKVFAPGCALMLYKPQLARKILSFLNQNHGTAEELLTCCQHDPVNLKKTVVINVCPGCDKRFGNDYKNTSTISLWEILAESEFFPFPDHKDLVMTILDACPTRDKERVHLAIRKILKKMNIQLTEPKNTRTKSICCGDSFYGEIPIEKVKEFMVKRATDMPVNDVVVYCISCIKSVYIGGRKPRYLLDLLFAENTLPGTYEPDEWHKELREYIELH